MLENDPANHLAETIEDTNPAPAPTTVADDLPRPPSGRRSATRPAGPPEPVTATAERAVTPVDDSEEAVAEEAEEDAPVAEAGEEVPAEEAPEQAAVDQEQQDAADPATPEASEPEPATPEALAPEPATPQASAPEPATLQASAPEASVQVSDEPEPDSSTRADEQAQPEQPADQPPRKSTRRRTTRARSDAGDDRAGASEIESALSAAEASAARSRRSRSGRPDDPADVGEVDTEQALASLAAAIAGRGEPPTAQIGPGVSPAELEAGVPQAESEPMATEEPILESAAADATSDDTADDAEDHDDVHGEEQATGTPSRRRRRRGGRRRRRSTTTDNGDDSQDDQAGDDDSGDDDQADDAASDDDQADDSADESTTETTGTPSRRRRRRRRRTDDSASDDDQGDVVVRVREPRRTLTDEISGIEGSTRLEAKKQRRREGRAAGRHRAPILTEAEFLARRESVERVMLVRQRDGYTQLAVLEDGVLVEHYVDRSTSTSLIGNIYLGRVQNVLPSMEAVFIDIGRGRNAVLYAGEVDWDSFDVAPEGRKVEQVFKSGQSVLVQVSKDPVGAKGARLTGHISIPGRYVVYSPGGHLSGISRKLPDAERQRLKQVLDSVLADESSVIVRTAAEGASQDELVRDVERLKAQWQQIEKRSKQGSAPQQLYTEPDLTLRIIRDTFTEDFKQLVVAGNGGADDAHDQIAAYIDHVAPQLSDRLVKWDTGEGDLFARYRLDEQISKALERKVFLPSGGSLVIDRTEAMTVIDVNTGKFTGSGGNLEETVTRNNLEAAEEIVRQLRLRDLGGIIVIDFIDMVLPANRELLLRRLVECLGRDRTRHQVSEVTSLGLVQMTRKRIGTGLAEAFTETCEHCGGRGYVRHDEPVDSQAPADGGERRGGRSGNGSGDSNRGRGRSANARRTRSEEASKANQVQPSEVARQAAAKVAAASRHHLEQPASTDGIEPAQSSGVPMAEPAAAAVEPVVGEPAAANPVPAETV